MRKIYFLAILLLSIAVKAQSLQFIDEGPINVGFMPSTSLTFSPEVEVLNSSTSKINVVWERTIISMPNGWEVQICDPNSCYLSQVSSNQFQLNVGSKAKMKMGVQIQNGSPTEGCAIVELKVKNAANPDINDIIIFNMCADPTGFNTVISTRKDFRIFPNPVTFTLNLEFNGYDFDEINAIEIYSLVGKKIDVIYPQNLSDVFQYPAYDLSEGMYLVNIVDRNGRVLGTKRFSKVD